MTTTTITEILTLARANELLDAAVAERGADYVYSKPESYEGSHTCLYVHQDENGGKGPGCIVAHVLHAFGVPLERLEWFEGIAASGVVGQAVEGNVETGVVDLLGKAQRAQDRSRPWGEAVTTARRELDVLA